MDDIFLYLYNYKKNNNQYGKYSHKFELMYKNKNYKSKKTEFVKKCKKYDIDNNNRLVKRIIIKDIVSNKRKLKNLIMIP